MMYIDHIHPGDARKSRWGGLKSRRARPVFSPKGSSVLRLGVKRVPPWPSRAGPSPVKSHAAWHTPLRASRFHCTSLPERCHAFRHPPPGMLHEHVACRCLMSRAARSGRVVASHRAGLWGPWGPARGQVVCGVCGIPPVATWSVGSVGSRPWPGGLWGLWDPARGHVVCGVRGVPPVATCKRASCPHAPRFLASVATGWPLPAFPRTLQASCRHAPR